MNQRRRSPPAWQSKTNIQIEGVLKRGKRLCGRLEIMAHGVSQRRTKCHIVEVKEGMEVRESKLAEVSADTLLLRRLTAIVYQYQYFVHHWQASASDKDVLRMERTGQPLKCGQWSGRLQCSVTSWL